MPGFALLLAVLSLASCSQVPSGVGGRDSLVPLTLTLTGAGLRAQGVPADGQGAGAVTAVKVKVRDARGGLLHFDGTLFREDGARDHLTLSRDQSRVTALLPAGRYTFESVGLAGDGAFLAYGTTEPQDVGADAPAVALGLHTLADPEAVTLALRGDPDEIGPGSEVGARLNVLTPAASGTRFQVPTGDYEVQYTPSQGTLLSRSKLGATVGTAATATGDLTLNASVQAWVATGPESAAYRTLPAGVTRPFMRLAAVGLHEEDDPALTYTGAWTREASGPSRGGHDMYTSAPGARLSLNFRGNGVSLYGNKFNTAGRFAVYLDGNLAETVDMYSDTDAPQSEFFRRDRLDPDTIHTLELVSLDSQVTVFDYLEIR